VRVDGLRSNGCPGALTLCVVKVIDVANLNRLLKIALRLTYVRPPSPKGECQAAGKVGNRFVEKSNWFSIPFDNKMGREGKGYVAFDLVTHALLCWEAIWLAFKTVYKRSWKCSATSYLCQYRFSQIRKNTNINNHDPSAHNIHIYNARQTETDKSVENELFRGDWKKSYFPIKNTWN
jgi:hypothetical protein